MRFPIQGKERRHFKMECVSKEPRTTILRKIKIKRPEKIFVNEYLTKTRSNFLHKLRSLRKNHATLSSVYCLIKWQYLLLTVSSEKPVCVDDSSEINKLELSVSNAKL